MDKQTKYLRATMWDDGESVSMAIDSKPLKGRYSTESVAHWAYHFAVDEDPSRWNCLEGLLEACPGRIITSYDLWIIRTAFGGDK